MRHLMSLVEVEAIALGQKHFLLSERLRERWGGRGLKAVREEG